MPAPDKQLFSQLAKVNFTLQGIRLPMDWSIPGDQYSRAFTQTELAGTPNAPTCLFREASLNQYHTETAEKMGQSFEKFIDGICGAISDAIDRWMKMAMIAGVMINGPVGVLLPGNVTGPPLMSLILSGAPKSTPQELKYTLAIASAFDTHWSTWHMGLCGILMYPSFAAVPAPMAPPTPNTPLPLIALISPGEAGLAPASLSALMLANLGDPTALHARQLFDSIARAFAIVFLTFKASTLVQKVQGTGAVPSFAPPFAPVGPVIGGTVIPTPGVLQ